MSHRITSPCYGETVSFCDLEIAAWVRPVFVLSRDFLGLRNHIVVIPPLGQGVGISGTTKSKRAKPKKPTTRETAGVLLQRSLRRRQRTGFWRPSQSQCGTAGCAGMGPRPRSATVSDSEELPAPHARRCGRPGTLGSQQLGKL